MKEIRQNFEAWYLLSGRRSDLERDGNGYFFNRVNTAWMAYQEAWKKSRAALVLEEWDFDTFSPNDCGEDAVWMTEVKRTLGKVGIIVKGEGDEN